MHDPPIDLPPLRPRSPSRYSENHINNLGYVFVMPHWSYDEGYGYCSGCSKPIPPFQAYFYNMRCPYCGKKIRGDQHAVEKTVLRKLKSIISIGGEEAGSGDVEEGFGGFE